MFAAQAGHSRIGETDGRHITEAVDVQSVSHGFDDGISLIELSGTLSHSLFYQICTAVSNLDIDIRTAKIVASKSRVRASLYVYGVRSQSESDVKRRVARSLLAVRNS